MPKMISTQYYNDLFKDKVNSDGELELQNIEELKQLIDFENRRLNNPQEGVSIDALKPLSLDSYVRLFLEKSGDFNSEKTSQEICDSFFPVLTFDQFRYGLMERAPFASYNYNKMKIGGPDYLLMNECEQLLIVPFLHEDGFENLDFVYNQNEPVILGYGRSSYLYKYLPTQLQQLSVKLTSNSDVDRDYYLKYQDFFNVRSDSDDPYEKIDSWRSSPFKNEINWKLLELNLFHSYQKLRLIFLESLRRQRGK